MSNIETAESSEPLQRPTNNETIEPRFIIGHGRRGGWIVNDRLGLVGGIFTSEAAARHYAFEESGGHKESMIVLSGPGTIKLDLREAA
jgi:hypothetical protein